MASASQPAVEIMGLMHGGVTVSDMAASLAFYHDGLGLPVAIDTVRVASYTHQALALPFTDIRLVLLTIPGTPGCFIELLEYRGADGVPAASRPCDAASSHICLEVRDLAAAHARLTSLGYRSRSAAVVDVDAGPNTGGKLVYMADPDGYWIELVERPRMA